MIHSPGYKESISFARARDHALWGRAFRKAIEAEPAPDIIFCAYPTIEAAAVCVRFGKERGIPVVVDLRDMWPDIFSERAPAALRPVAQAALWPVRARARAALRGATALFAITEEFLAWGLRFARRPRGEWDAAYLLAFPAEAPPLPDDATQRPTGRAERTAELDLGAVGSTTHGRSRRRRNAAARSCSAAKERVKFILAGDGDDLAGYRAQARGCDNVPFRLAQGTADQRVARPCAPRAGAISQFPDLVVRPEQGGRYFAAGLPVATCLGGTLARLLAAHACRLQFSADSPASLVQRRQLRSDEPRRPRSAPTRVRHTRGVVSRDRLAG
jgi:hypothetical protein